METVGTNTQQVRRKTFKYRLYPTRVQERTLVKALVLCRELYNASLEERTEAFRMCRVHITYNQQANQLPDIKELRPEYNDIYSQVLQDILRRVDKAMKAFFRRVQAGEKAGYPRFKSSNRFDSFTYPQAGFSLTQDQGVLLSKIGTLKMRLHRPIEGSIKTCTIKREVDQWYIVLTCEVEANEPLPKRNEPVGVDMGVIHFATLSTGEKIEHPHHYRRAKKQLAKQQQAIMKKKKGSHRQKKAKGQLAKLHRKVKNQRQDFLHKLSRKLVASYSTICFERLNIAGMSKRPKPKRDGTTKAYVSNGAGAKAGLNQAIRDAGWYRFQLYCTYKAEDAGGSVVFVNPRNTSQRCSTCGQIVEKTLADRWHSCECGTELDRDHNSALNIKRLGSSQQHSAML